MADERMARAIARYEAALHGMQTGVGMEQARGCRDGEPKHLRVGVNSALVDCAAIAKLLIAKGVFTEIEYFEAVADAMEQERSNYETRLSAALGTKVALG